MRYPIPIGSFLGFLCFAASITGFVLLSINTVNPPEWYNIMFLITAFLAVILTCGLCAYCVGMDFSPNNPCVIECNDENHDEFYPFEML